MTHSAAFDAIIPTANPISIAALAPPSEAGSVPRLARFLTAARRDCKLPAVAAHRLASVVQFLDDTLEAHRFADYGPNGLQVEACDEVARVVTGVSASQALLDRAAELGADLVVVHHGLLWGAAVPRVTGLVARRLRTLFAHEMSLAAYHLPLDRHPRLGNNAGLGDALGLPVERHAFGEVKGQAIGLYADFATPLASSELIARATLVRRGGVLPFVFAHGPAELRRVGICTGAASDLLEDAARAGCDAFVTGELAKRAGEVARELGVTLIAAGHGDTEVFGPMRLAAALAEAFPGLVAEFVDVPTPL